MVGHDTVHAIAAGEDHHLDAGRLVQRFARHSEGELQTARARRSIRLRVADARGVEAARRRRQGAQARGRRQAAAREHASHRPRKHCCKCFFLREATSGSEGLWLAVAGKGASYCTFVGASGGLNMGRSHQKVPSVFCWGSSHGRARVGLSLAARWIGERSPTPRGISYMASPGAEGVELPSILTIVIPSILVVMCSIGVALCLSRVMGPSGYKLSDMPA